jgi:16S rRNA (guanine527-N7)-methyltransferase
MTSRPPSDPGESIALGQRLNEILVALGEAPLDAGLTGEFGAYASLLMRWNARMNLTAVRDEEGILRRHFAESIACAGFLPAGIATLLDFGSGAGFPGLPIALCRREITVTLAESQGKKVAFLREAARVLGTAIRIHGGRAESLGERFDCVTLRAVDRMGDAVRVASGLVAEGGLLALLTTTDEEVAVKGWPGSEFKWESGRALSGSSERIVLLGRRVYVPRGTL